jgi:hypothetical protein
LFQSQIKQGLCARGVRRTGLAAKTLPLNWGALRAAQEYLASDAPVTSADDALENVERSREERDVLLRKLPQLARELGDSTLASFLHDLFPGGRRLDAYDAAIGGIDFARHEPRLLQRSDDARHRRRTDLFRGGEIAERDRSGEDDDRERGESGGTESRGVILSSQAAQQVNGGRMQPVRCFDEGIGGGGSRWFGRVGSCGLGHVVQFISYAN